ncbi:hypothetical protein [Halomonas ramblicola]|uniref:hypothetical protein n=1 Tax=Halomonas ramblicola TaxID=747349 RepID=UPI0025B2B1BE|nr:hypothetical protein [Halomonas ramblicola]MDN3520466.1 hypothetical protein [Halomonas ramblicola]
MLDPAARFEGVAAILEHVRKRFPVHIVPASGYNSSGIGKDLGWQAVAANLRFKNVLIDFAS